MAVELITKENVSLQLLKDVFENAYLDVHFNEDGDIFIKGSYKFWVELDESKRFIRFVIRFSRSEGKKLSEAIIYAHTINKDMIVLRSFALENAVVLDHHLWLEGGITPKCLIMNFKAFEWLVDGAIGRDDTGVIT